MAEPAATPLAESESGGWKKDLALLGLLLALVIPLRGWLFHNTEVPARDCIGFVRYALQFEQNPWNQVLLKNHQHPGYPFTIWLVSLPMRAIEGETTPAVMQASAQLASALAAILLLFPMYYLGKALFDRGTGFWGTLIFQYLPTSGHHLSDGISESLFLLLVTTSLLWGVLAIRCASPWRFALCGVFCGLAYLTRPEGALVAAAAGLTLAGMQGVAAWRLSIGRFHACAASLALGAALAGGVYAFTVGNITNKPALKLQFVEAMSASDHSVALENDPSPPSARQPLAASIFGAFFPKSDSFPMQLGRSLRALFAEINQSFHYVAGIPALFGLWWSWRRLRAMPASYFVGGYCLIHGATLVVLAMVASYVSDRHVMPIVLCCSFLVAVGLREIPKRFLAWRASGARPSTFLARQGRVLTVGLMLSFFAIAAPKTLQRLHANRTGNLAAGNWLAKHVAEGDVIDDDHVWSHFYAGMVMREGNERPLQTEATPICYVVLTRSRDKSLAHESRWEDEQKVRQQGPVVYHWPENRDLTEARVLIVARPRDPERQPWSVRRAP